MSHNTALYFYSSNLFATLLLLLLLTIKYRHAIYVMTCKLFADLERLKVREMEKKAEEKKRKAEETANDEVKSKTKKEWDKNYEVS